MTEVMLTKLLPPRISGELIERPRLLDVFVRNRNRKLIVVAAPAGYGKTVATLQYVNTLGTHLIWYQLDPYDNDPAVFIQYLITGFQRYFPGFGGAALHLALQGNIVSSLRFIVISLVNELTSLSERDFVIVLDDYHNLTNPVIRQFMTELLAHLPVGVNVVLVGRTTPDLPLAQLQVRDELDVLDGEALRFNETEVGRFLATRHIDASGIQLDSLIRKTDGWPAALKLLAGASGDNAAPPEKEMKYIYDYLASEVFDRQPEAIREFLLEASVLETITPDMCDGLMERNDSKAVLDDLEKQQLFLIPLSGPEKAYRYHQLFRDFLLERLGTRRNGMRRKVGKIAFDSGNLDQAMEYYLAAGFDCALLPLLQKAGREAFRQGRWQTAARWLERVPAERIQADSWLAFFLAQIRIYQGKTDEAESWIGKSLALFSAESNSIGIAECQFLQARILNGHGRHQESLNILEKAYPILHKATPFSRFDLPLEMAITLFRNDRYQEAENLLTQSLKVAEERNEFLLMAHLLEGLGHTYYLMGNHSKALQCYQRGMRVSPTQTLPNYNFQDLVAAIYQEWGELDAALEYAERSVTYKENLGMIEALPSAYYQLGTIYVDFGQLKKAEECYRKGIALTENGGEPYFLSMNRAYLSRCLGYQGRLAESLAMAEQALTETQSERLLASCRVICAPAFIQNGQIPKAKIMLLQALPLLERWNFAVPLSYCYATLAILHFKIGDLKSAGELSRKLLDLAARKNFIRLFITISEYRPILRYGLEQGIEVSYIQRVFARMRERGIGILGELTRHSDAAVRARTILPLYQVNNPASRELLAALSSDLAPEVRKTIKHYVNLSADLSWDIGESSEPDLPRSPRAVSVKPPLRRTESESDSDPYPFLQISLLGPARIILSDCDITNANWRFVKSRDLLLYLAHQGQPVGINQILEDLWPDLPPGKSLKTFYSVLYWLRQAIQKEAPSELVKYASKTCELFSTAYATDRNRFISLINAGSGDIGVSGRTLEALEEAVALYRGDYLSQLDYPWVIPEREHLKRLYLETVIRLAKHYLQTRDYLKTIAFLEPTAEQNPLREEIFGLLMSAYAALGDRLAVIRQYQKLKVNLLEDLGLEPAPEITKLYYQLCGSESSTRKRLKKA